MSSNTEFKEKESDKKILVPDPIPEPRDPETIITELRDEKGSSNSETLWQELLSSDDDGIGNYIIQQSPCEGASILWLAFDKEEWGIALKFLNRAPNASVNPNAYSRNISKGLTLTYILFEEIYTKASKNDALLVQLNQILDLLVDKSCQPIDLNGVAVLSSCLPFVLANFSLIIKDTERLKKLLNRSKLIDLNAPVTFKNADDSKKIWATTALDHFLGAYWSNISVLETFKLLLKHAKSGIDFNAKSFNFDNRKESWYAYRAFFNLLFKEDEAGKNSYTVIQLLVREQRYPVTFSSGWIEEKSLVMLQLLSLALQKQDHLTFLKLMDAGMYPPIKKIQDWTERSRLSIEENNVAKEMYAAGRTSSASIATTSALPNLLKEATLAKDFYENLKQDMIFIGWIVFAKQNSKAHKDIRLIFYPYWVKMETELEHAPKPTLLAILEKFVVRGVEQLQKELICRMVKTAAYIYTKNYGNVHGLVLPQWDAMPKIFRLALDDRGVVPDFLLQDLAFRRGFYQKIKESAEAGKHLCVRDIKDLVQQTKISLGKAVPELKSKSEQVLVKKPNTFSKQRQGKLKWRPVVR